VDSLWAWQKVSGVEGGEGGPEARGWPSPEREQLWVREQQAAAGKVSPS